MDSLLFILRQDRYTKRRLVDNFELEHASNMQGRCIDHFIVAVDIYDVMVQKP